MRLALTHWQHWLPSLTTSQDTSGDRMRIAAISRIEPLPVFETLPIAFRQRPSRLSAVGLLLVCAPVLALLLLPFGLLAALAAEHPEALSTMVERPATAIQLALGFLVAIALATWPLRTLFNHIRSGRDVRIDASGVSVCEHGLFGSSQWSAPLESFRGVAAHLRASLSGTRHEIILVHPAPEKCILLHFADRPAQIRTDQIAALLGLPEIPIGEYYSRRQIAGRGPLPATGRLA